MTEFNKMITMGCSWTAGEGDDLDSSNVTPGWVGRVFKKLNRDGIKINDLENLGTMGDSNWIQYAHLAKYLNCPKCLVIWGMSAFSRDIVNVDDEWKTIKVHHPNWRQYYLEYNDHACQLKHLYMIHSFQQLVNNFDSEHFIFLSFDDISRFNGLYDLGEFNHVYDLIDWDRIITNYSMCDYISQNNSASVSIDAQEYKMGLTKFFERINMKKHENFCHDGHPSPKGYDLWANHLYDWILPKIQFVD